ncbi:uncharacterized mitochondrial protein AtMg00810-like [Impatiens glandulifera]|uniref:uncharacterized mitochondrial protein AtMg00810-like n=1 Tax=Impatiens glandulifera TaxID=253017 RepID=UPI001FB05EA4|nr:uncharacterized mitochondrial protein AtMg00810-like [Impatiens glandulifera]
MLVVLLYVDDIILTSNNYDDVVRLQDELSLRFEMEKLGERTFLGLQIENSIKSRRRNMSTRSSSVSCSCGMSIYLTITRPDIAYAVRVVSRYMHEPRKPHLEEAKKILKYINTSLDIGLLYKKDAKFVLQGFEDADFAGDRND